MWNFRRSLIRQLRMRGHEVTIVAPQDDYLIRFQDDGIQTINLSIAGRGVNIFRELWTVLSYLYHMVRVRPDIFLGFTVKPVLYGGLASRLLGVESVATITGLGIVFLKESMVTKIVRSLYRHVLRDAKQVIFQNNTDLELFRKEGMVQGKKMLRVHGSGVDLTRFKFVEPKVRNSADGLIFLTLARPLKDKGIYELASAAEAVKSRFPATEFLLAGAPDPTATGGIPLSILDKWNESGLIRYLGLVEDVVPLLMDADCVILPSYREGLSRSLLEAAASGRPSITADVPGCRDVVVDGKTGLLCLSQSAEDLAEKISYFVQMPSTERSSMGQAARTMAEKYFSETVVVDAYLHAIENMERQM